MPPRSVWGLRCQFYLQWLYLPVGFLVFLAASILGGSGDSGPFGGRRKGVPKDPYGDTVLLSRREYRLELCGTPEEWRERAGFALRQAIAEGPVRPGEPLFLAASTYRGLGLDGVDELARPLGWRVDWPRLRYTPGGGVHLVAVR